MAIRIPLLIEPGTDIYSYDFTKDLYRTIDSSVPENLVTYDLFKDLSSTNYLYWGNLPPQIFVPAGSILPFGGSTVPAGWLLCDGAAVSRGQYSALFAAISTTYGSGDGSTTFNVPNLQGRVPVGRLSTDANFDVLGETGGSSTVTLTSSQIPAHTHGIKSNTSGNNTGVYSAAAGGFVDSDQGAQGTETSDANTGGGGSHNNLQPYIVINYIIKT